MTIATATISTVAVSPLSDKNTIHAPSTKLRGSVFRQDRGEKWIAKIAPKLPRTEVVTMPRARASIHEDQLQHLDSLKLVPGMPAEIFIQTHQRTPLQYLLKPLREQIARTFRER